MASSEIRVDIEIMAPAGAVWGIVSDVDREPEYWKGTKSVRNISRDGGLLRREITIAFRDQKCMQDVRICVDAMRVDAEFTEGIIKGTKSVQVIARQQAGGGSPDAEPVLLRTVWDVRMTGLMGMFTGMLKGHIRNGTEMAMQSIKAAAEGSRE